jgi:arylsulfatase A-like enzyme
MGDSAAVRRGRWKLLRERADAPAALYDLGADVREERDLAAAEPAEAAALAGLLREWERGLVPPRWVNERPR